MRLRSTPEGNRGRPAGNWLFGSDPIPGYLNFITLDFSLVIFAASSECLMYDPDQTTLLPSRRDLTLECTVLPAPGD